MYKYLTEEFGDIVNKQIIRLQLPVWINDQYTKIFTDYSFEKSMKLRLFLGFRDILSNFYFKKFEKAKIKVNDVLTEIHSTKEKLYFQLFNPYL